MKKIYRTRMSSVVFQTRQYHHVFWNNFILCRVSYLKTSVERMPSPCISMWRSTMLTSDMAQLGHTTNVASTGFPLLCLQKIPGLVQDFLGSLECFFQDTLYCTCATEPTVCAWPSALYTKMQYPHTLHRERQIKFISTFFSKQEPKLSTLHVG